MSVENDLFILWLRMHPSSHSHTPVTTTQGGDLCPQFEKHNLREPSECQWAWKWCPSQCCVTKECSPKTPTALGWKQGWVDSGQPLPAWFSSFVLETTYTMEFYCQDKSQDKDVEKYITWANKFLRNVPPPLDSPRKMLAKRDPDTANQAQESIDGGEGDKRAKKEGSTIIESELHAAGKLGWWNTLELGTPQSFNMIRMGSMSIEFARVDLELPAWAIWFLWPIKVTKWGSNLLLEITVCTRISWCVRFIVSLIREWDRSEKGGVGVGSQE